MTDPDALTAEQRAAIIDAIPVARGLVVLPIYPDRGKLSRSLVDMGLAGWSSRGAALTKAGKELRAKLHHRPRLGGLSSQV
jgi:hypothetical protein